MARKRDANGDLVPDPVKFTNRIKAVIDYTHNNGLIFSFYNCAGTRTCTGYTGTGGYEFQDAPFYARVGIDFLK